LKDYFKKSTAIWIILTISVFTAFVSSLYLFCLSALPFTFIYLELGKVLGVFSKQDLALTLFGIGVGITSIIVIGFFFKFRKLENTELFTLIKKKILKPAIFSLMLALLFLLLLSTVPILGIMQQHSKIDGFVAENTNVSLQEYIERIKTFIPDNINDSYNNSKSAFEIDPLIYSSFLDPTILNALGLTRADVIFYQHWGACGQSATVTDELLHDAGYTTRQGYFIGEGADHQWAEVKLNNSWFVVDPWYIGSLVEISNLRWAMPDFENYTTVKVMYRNGTTLDLGKDYGYYPNTTLSVFEAQIS